MLRPLALSLALLLAASSGARASFDAAVRISEAAAITGTRVLLIGFEGLAGFNPSGSNQASIYQCQLTYGMKAQKPLALSGQVLKALALPVIEKYKNKVKVIMFAHDACTGSGSLPEAIAAQWMADAGRLANSNGRRVIIMGHSFGGDAATVLGQALASRNIPVDSVITIDPRKRPLGLGGFRKYGTGRWINYYQITDFAMRGWQVAGAENHMIPGVHILLPHNNKILASLMGQIGEPPGETTLVATNAQVCNTAQLGDVGLYKGTSGVTEAIPIAAVLGGGGYLAYMAFKGKKGSSDSGVSAPSPISAARPKSGDSKGESKEDDEKKEEEDKQEDKEAKEEGESETDTAEEKDPGSSTGSSRMAKLERAQAAARGPQPETPGIALASGPLTGPDQRRFAGRQTSNNLGGATAALSTIGQLLPKGDGLEILPAAGLSHGQGNGIPAPSLARNLESGNDWLKLSAIPPPDSGSLFLRVRSSIRKHLHPGP